MGQKWIRMLVILVFYQQITSGTAEERVIREGSQVDIKCKPDKEKGTLVIWFRVLDHSGMNFIASFSPTGQVKSRGPNYDLFNHRKQGENEYVLTLKSFRSSDSGIYSCGSLVGGNILSFGEVTRLNAEKQKEPTKAAPTCTTSPTPPTTATSCVCKDKFKTAGPPGVSMLCAPIILGSLAGGCGLLLLILIFVTVYCNQMRTRRCPHHYKRKPRMAAPDKMRTNI